MMFQADTAFATELIALVLGTALLVWVSQETVSCKAFGKIVAYFTIVAAILGMLCTGYYTMRYWEDGYFHRPDMTSMYHHSMGRMGDIKDCPMMKQKMMNKKMMNPMMDQEDQTKQNQHHD